MINYSIAIKGTKPGRKKDEIIETKAYGEAQIKESLSFDTFCNLVTDHHSPFSTGTIKGVFSDVVECLRNQMLAGNRVRLGELGDFHVELSTRGADTPDDFNIGYINKVIVRWTPGKSFKNLRQEALFQLVPSREAQADAIDVVRNEDTIQGVE